jgi:hypothetical protein
MDRTLWDVAVAGATWADLCNSVVLAMLFLADCATFRKRTQFVERIFYPGLLLFRSWGDPTVLLKYGLPESYVQCFSGYIDSFSVGVWV